MSIITILIDDGVTCDGVGVTYDGVGVTCDGGGTSSPDSALKSGAQILIWFRRNQYESLRS